MVEKEKKKDESQKRKLTAEELIDLILEAKTFSEFKEKADRAQLSEP